jgi:hypothetical protein
MKTRTLVATMAARQWAAARRPARRAGVSKEMKLAFDFTDGNPVVLLNKLNNVDVTHKQLTRTASRPRL